MRDFQKPGRSTVFAMNGMCATSHPLAAQTAVRVLDGGGNAVDAAIAAAMVLNTCEPQMTGLGGDMFALVRKPGEPVRGLNGSGRAPAGLSAEALRAEGLAAIPADHPAAITVPGAVDGFCALHEAFGSRGLDELLAPAIRHAEEGVPVAPRTAFDWSIGVDLLAPSAGAAYSIDGRAPAPGEVFRAPGQAEVLRRIAVRGRAGFYEGEVAADMLAALRAIGGTHTEADLDAARADWVEPLSLDYKGRRLIELPPNGQGAAAMLLCNILKEFDLAALDPFGAERAHLEAEATKLAYDARNRFVADPRHATRVGHLLSADTSRGLAKLVQPRSVIADPAPLSEAVHRDTVYLTVVDRDRMAVSLIYSIFRKFGSGHASDRFGILFHNRGSGFNLIEGHPNEAGPGKRPMHTIIPAMLEEPDGSLVPFGVMGGAYQAAGHSRFATNVVDYGMDLQDAIDGPRCFAVDGELRVERGYAPAVHDALAALGHRVVVPEEPIGGAQAIRIDEARGVLEGASDPRKDGIALGL
ncbi:gamma-glutamyltransferase [Rhodobacterales bacterium HKCCE2091]|nr:gamma-glutamyltransferase [Rhodobacterales bacterium HKCCE2091]